MDRKDQEIQVTACIWQWTSVTETDFVCSTPPTCVQNGFRLTGKSSTDDHILPQTNGGIAPPPQHDTQASNSCLQHEGPDNLPSTEAYRTTTRSLDRSSHQPHDEPRAELSAEPHPASAPPSLHPIRNQPPSPPRTQQRIPGHNHRHRRRLLRWLRHPLPWNMSLRRRAENIRRRIMDVDRVLP